MVRQLQPYELTEHYHRARHNRFDSCLFSGLSLTAALTGLGLFLGMPNGLARNYAAGSCWLGATLLANRASNSSRESSKYSNRIKALNQFSEESIIYDLARALQINQTGAAMATAEPAQPGISQRDLTAEIARYDGHVLFASRTRSGKTTSIQSAIAQTVSHHQGNLEFWIFDPKGARWCGLEANQDRYLFCNNAGFMPSVMVRLERLVAIMEARQQQRMKLGGHWSTHNAPSSLYIVIDEFNSLLSLAREFDGSLEKGEAKQRDRLLRLVERFIFQGAEDKVYVWLMAQTTRVDKLGLDTSVQDNLAYFAQSRCGDYQSVEDAISNTYVVANAKQRKSLQTLLESYQQDRMVNREIPIAFTTLGGNQLCQLPDLSYAKTVQVATPPNRGPGKAQESHPEQENPTVDFLQKCLDLPLASEPILEAELLDESVDEESQSRNDSILNLAKYIKGKGAVSLREVKQNWGKNYGFKPDDVADFLITLMRHGKVEVYVPEGSRGEWVKWMGFGGSP